MMKKIFAFAMLLAAAAVASVSCTKDVATDTNPAPELSGLTKTVALNQIIAETRTQQNSEKALEWAQGDTFGIFCVGDDETGKVLSYIKSPAYGSNDTTVEVPEETKYFYCVYPYDEDLKEQETIHAVLLSIPQSPSLSSEFDGSKVFMVAKGEISEENSVDLEFTPIVAVFEFNIYNSAEAAAGKTFVVNTIGLDVNDSEDAWCAGSMYLDFSSFDNDGFIAGGSSLMTAVCEDDAEIGTTKDAGAKYYLYLAKADYEKINVEINVSEKLDDGDYSPSVAYKVSYSNVSFKDKYGYTLDIDLAKAKTDSNAGKEVGEKWEFTSSEWQSFIETLSSDSADRTKYNTTINGVTVFNNGETALRTGSTDKSYIQLGSGGVNKQYLAITVPASGVLKLVVAGTSSSTATNNRTMNVKVGDTSTELKEICTVDQNTKETLSYDINIYKETTLYIYSSDGHRLYSIEFIETKVEPTVWHFSDESWQTIIAEANERNTKLTAEDTEETPYEFSALHDGLKVYDTKDKTKDFLTGGEDTTQDFGWYFKLPSGSTYGDQQNFSFKATSSGKLMLVVGGTSTDPSSRQMKVRIGDELSDTNIKAEECVVPQSEQADITFDIEIEEDTNIYIFSSNGHRLYSVTYTGSVEK